MTRDAKSQLHADEHFRRFDAEAWIIRKLGNPSHIVDGTTTYETRQAGIRAEILNRNLEDVPMVSKGKHETYSQVFERFYSEPLTKKQAKGNAA